ncbi:TonB-dependent receptor plug domain-containing protein, partial [bacterium]|nr:TonB-dependent receptor plug domain-containing protein [bacterium]
MSLSLLSRGVVASLVLLLSAVGVPRVLADNGAVSPEDVAGADDEQALPLTNAAPEVVVTATRLPAEQVALARYPAHVTVLGRPAIEAAPSFTMPQLLQQQAGLTSVDTVGFGQFGNLSLRGYGERTGALILLDGMRVNDAGDSTAPYLWNSLPLADVERIEIIRGGASTTYGEGAIGGVINIITRPPPDTPVQVTASGAGGNLGYYSGHLALSGRDGAFDYRVSGTRQEWNGWRDSSAYRGWTTFVRPAVDTPAGRFSLSYQYHDQTVENPGALTAAEFKDNPRQASPNKFVFDNRLHRVGLDYTTTLDGGLTVAGKVYGQDYDTTSSSSFGDGRIEQPNIGTTWQASYASEPAGLVNTVTVGFELIQQDFASTFDSFGTRYLTEADNWTASGFIQDTLAVTDDLSLLAGESGERVITACSGLAGFAAIGMIGSFVYDKALQQTVVSQHQDRYRLDSFIDQGGMGIVYKGWDQRLGRSCAIKVIASGEDERWEEVRQRFEQEAQKTSQLSGSHVVEIYDYGVTYYGDMYYAMEFMEGMDISSLVRT